ncbi:hypothetical protein GCM10025794_13020 [Massilia kyonggiensis]
MTKMDAAASDSDSDRFDTDVTWMLASSSRLSSAMSSFCAGTTAWAAGAARKAAMAAAGNNVELGIMT